MEDWHLAFGLMWTIGIGLLALSLMQPTLPDCRGETAKMWLCGLLLAAVVVGVVGRLLTPGAFWHS